VENEVKTIIADEADRLARKYRIKDKRRVQAILERTATDPRGHRMPPDGVRAVLPFKSELVFHPSLYEALLYLPPEKALAIFESIDPLVLSQRSYLVKYFLHPTTPFYTLHELADLAEQFLTHLERNRDFLIKTGFPRTSFDESKWFECYLSRLYFVKLPVSVWPNRSPVAQKLAERERAAERDAEGNRIYSYSWTCQCPLARLLRLPKDSSVSREPVRSTVSVSSLPSCAYEEAAVAEALPAHWVQRLEEGREKYYRVKIELICTLIRCIRSSSKHRDVWAESLKTLTRALTREEVDFYLNADYVYGHSAIGPYLASRFYRLAITDLWGGISNLIYVAGHFEKEVTVGTFDRTKSAISDQLRDLQVFESYYQVVGRPFQSDFDKALDAFWELEGREKRFWADFQKRVIVAFEERFKVPVRFEIHLEARYEQRFKYVQEPRLHAEARQLEETGTFIVGDERLRSGRLDVVLSGQQEKDYDDFRYKRYDQVHFPGNIERDGRNVVEINEYEARLGDRGFNLLFRLAAQLKKDKEGWVHTSTLETEGILADVESYQVFDRLRSSLEPCLTGTTRRDLIENVRSKGYRVSTHPDFITYDKKRLLEQFKDVDARVIRIVEGLPELTE